MKYKHVLFDWDGTLSMTIDIWLRGWRQELSKIGYDLDDETIVADFFYEHHKAKLKYPEIDFEDIVKNLFSYVEEHSKETKPYPGSADMIESLLNEGVSIALVTSSSRHALENGLHSTGLKKYFHTIVTGDDITHHKPHPEPILKVIDLAGFEKESAIIIGDSRADILGGKAAGIATCAFTPPQNELTHDFEEVLSHKPDYVVTNHEEFRDLVLK